MVAFLVSRILLDLEDKLEEHHMLLDLVGKLEEHHMLLVLVGKLKVVHKVMVDHKLLVVDIHYQIQNHGVQQLLS